MMMMRMRMVVYWPEMKTGNLDLGEYTNVGRTRWETMLYNRTSLVDPRRRNWFRIRIRITRVVPKPFSRIHKLGATTRLTPHAIAPTGETLLSFILSTLNPLSSLFLLLSPPVLFKGSRFLCPSILLQKYKLRFGRR